MSEDVKDLTEFGGGAEVKPPLVRRERIVPSPTAPDKPAGFLGRECKRKSEPWVYTSRRGRYHYYYEGDGYSISDSILKRFESVQKPVSRIFFWERNPPYDVYEFTLRQYLDGDPVPERDLMDKRDPQTYVPLDEAKHEWPRHGEDMHVWPFEKRYPELLEKRRNGRL